MTGFKTSSMPCALDVVPPRRLFPTHERAVHHLDLAP